MKKILIGLMAVSTISLAATVKPGNNPSSGSPVFGTGQEGKVTLKGTVTSTIPTDKYVVFASTGNGSTVGDDIVDFGTFYVTTGVTATGISGISGTLPTVYVKRANGNSITSLKSTDKVTFALYLPSTNKKTNFEAKGGKLYFTPFNLLSTTQLDAVKKLGANLSLTNAGYIRNTSGQYFINTYDLGVEMKSEGVITFFNFLPGWTSEKPIPEQSKVLDYFKSGIQVESNQAAILVKVNA